MESTEESDSCGRESETRRIERAHRGPLVLLEEPTKRYPDIEKGSRVDGVDVIVSTPVVDAEEVVAGGQYAVDLARPVVAQFSSPVAREPEEAVLLVTELMVDPSGFRVEY